MLQEIRVDGFRSLIGFKIDLQPGLNIIVGPNGTGKSNFISFLDFLSALITTGLNAAIANAQGAGSVFSQENFSNDSASLCFSLSGSCSYMYEEEGQYHTSPISYTFSCTLRYLRAIPAIYVEDEKLTFDCPNFPRLEIGRETRRENNKFVSQVRIIPDNHPVANSFYRWRRAEEDVDTATYLSSILTGDTSILSMLFHHHQVITAVATDVSRYRSINIDPAVARKPSPVGTTSEIAPNGEGLAGALYRMERGTYYPYTLSMWMPSRDADRQKADFQQIMSWCREVNSDIVRADVHLDFQEALLRPVMKYNFEGAKAEFPFRRISDGTVKWLTLVTILISESNLSVIEEPENFLHPFMQEAFVALCRQVLADEPERSFVVSTHSPTLLDCCSPNELTMFESVSGKTQASRVANREELVEAIGKSRFGLGYYYKTGGVYGEDRRPG